MATIKDIAKECGVSIATVSNALNNKGRVSDEMIAKILESAKKLGYVPDITARNLKRKDTKVIGIIAEDITVFNTADIVDGINEYLDENGYSFVLGNLRLFRKFNNNFYHNDEYRKLAIKEFDVMVGQRVSGIIYVAAHSRQLDIVPSDLQVPVVVAYSYDKDNNIPSVMYDDKTAAYEAVKKLIKKGHKKIGLITGEETSLHTIERKKGYEQALFENKMLLDPSIIVSGNWHRDGGKKAAKTIIENGANAIFCMSDIMSVGVYDYAHENNISIGKDISLISFDNREISEYLSPALSTMAIPLGEIGRTSAKIMIDSLENDTTCAKTIKLACHYIPRSSF